VKKPRVPVSQIKSETRNANSHTTKSHKPGSNRVRARTRVPTVNCGAATPALPKNDGAAVALGEAAANGDPNAGAGAAAAAAAAAGAALLNPPKLGAVVGAGELEAATGDAEETPEVCEVRNDIRIS
jgi:hypothetical protein